MKKSVLQRQAIVTTIRELKEIIAGLEQDISVEQRVQLNIINRHKTSDTWEFEKIMKGGRK